MKKAFNLIFGIAFGMLPLFGTAILSLFIYDYQPNISISIVAVLIVLAVYVGFRIARRIYVYGIVEYLTYISATSEMDNLQPTSDSNIELRNPADLVHLIAINEHLCKGGNIRIFGDWFGQPYDGEHIIERVKFDSDTSVMTIYFEKGETLIIENPEHIHESPSYIKVITADKIKLAWRDENSQNTYFKTYEKAKRKINVSTNCPEPKWKTDVSLAATALVIYGKIG